MTFLARFRTQQGLRGVPLSRGMVLEGFQRLGLRPDIGLRAMNNLHRGLPVLVGGCVLTRTAGDRAGQGERVWTSTNA